MQGRVDSVLRPAAFLLCLALSSCGGGGSPHSSPPAPDFTISVSPASLSVVQAATSSPVTITVNGQNGFTGNVSVAITGLPAEVTTSPAAPITVAAGGSQTVTFAASAAAPTGSSTVTFSATGGNLSHSASLALTVSPKPDFTLSVSPGSLSVGQAGVSSPVTVTVNGQNGFTGSVSVAVTGLPSGVTTAPATPFTVAAGGSQTVTFAASPVAVAGPTTVTFSGASGSLSHSTGLALTVTVTADFTLSVSPGSLSIAQAAPGSSVSVTVNPRNGFAGTVSVAVTGLPPGVTTAPATPFPVVAGASQTVTFTASGVAPAGSTTVMLNGTSGGLSDATSLSFAVTPTPLVVKTYQQGSVLYLEADIGNETSRIGLQTQWGGTVIEASWNGTNFVNQHDDGREVQAALYDGNAKYDNCAGCTGVFGWDPTQGGDKYGHGSPVILQTLAADSIYVKTQPYQWNPDDKGGGPNQPVLGDAYMEQTVTPVPNHPRAFQLHYKITHFGTDSHAQTGQEFPAVYVNVDFDRFVYYGGTNPWTNDPVTAITLPLFPEPSPLLYLSEKWGAYVNDQDIGLAVYVPAQYPYGGGVRFLFSGSGPTGDSTNYYAPFVPYAWAPGGVLEGDNYLVAGDYQDARAAIYDLENALPPSDILPPIGNVDAPVPNSQIAGTVNVAGWTFDDTAVSKVEVYVDNVLAGAATYGSPRPDVATVWPNAPTDVGYNFSLDTTKYANGPHTIVVRAADPSGNTAVLASSSAPVTSIPVTIQN